MSNTYIITGATGFLGEQLTKKILADGNNVVLIGKSKGEKTFSDRVWALFQDFDKKRIFTVEADLSDISVDDLRCRIESLSLNISGIWHLAANLSFKDEDKEKVFKTNIDGVQKMASLALKLGVTLFHTSTAYVHGRQSGLAKEEFEKRPKKFNNPYEESKYIAETVVKDTPNLKFIIFRPSIMYDRKAEFVTNFGYYSFLIALFKIKKRVFGGIEKKVFLPFPFFYFIKSRLNLMPTDIALDWMYRISKIDNSLCKIFHITNPKPFSVGEIFKQTFEAFNVRIPLLGTPAFVAYLYFLSLDLLSYIITPLRPVAQRIYYFKWYLLKHMYYDMQNTYEILGRSINQSFDVNDDHILNLAKAVIVKIENYKKK